MDLALLHPTYWPEVRRGSERVLHDLAGGLLARGHRPRILTSHRARATVAVEEGVQVQRVYRPPAWRLAWRQRHLTHVPLAYTALRRMSPDVANAFYVTDALASARWSRATGRPSVFSIMGVPEPSALEYALQRRVWRRALDGATALTVLSSAALEGLRETWGRDDAEIVPPGVDISRFPVGTERDAAPTLLCPAAIDAPRKRIALLVEAFAELRRRVPDARLLLAGPGDDAAAVRVGLPAPGVERIAADATTLPALYGRAWLTVLPSRAEAFGLVLVESLACGTPVVGTDTHGIAEIIRGGDDVGRVFEGDDPGALADALESALGLADAAAIRTRCRARAEDFSNDASVDRYIAVYERLRA